MEQNRGPRNVDTHKYSQLIFDKGAEVIQQSKDSLFNKWLLEQLDIYMQKNESRYRLYILLKC